MIGLERILEDALRRAEAIAHISPADTGFNRVLLVLAEDLYIVPMPEALVDDRGIRGVTDKQVDYVVYIEQEGEEVFVYVGGRDGIEVRKADAGAKNGHLILSAWEVPEAEKPAAKIIENVFA